MRISDWSSDVCSSDLAQHIAVAGIADEGEDALIATGRLADFRCCFGKVGAGGTIDAASADLLGVADGDEISWIGRSYGKSLSSSEEGLGWWRARSRMKPYTTLL